MFGTQGLVNRIILERKDNPISSIGDITKLKIIEVMFDEQWKELNRKFQFAEECAITVPHFGRFAVNNSKLRKYIRNGIKQLRKLRKRIEILKTKKDFNPENSMSVVLERDLTLKIRASWKQLDNLRMLWINKEKYYKRKKLEKQTIIQ